MSVRYVLSPEAAAELVQIWGYVRKKADVEIANRVEAVIRQKIDFLVSNPGVGHSRKDLTDEPVAFFPVYSYLHEYSDEVRYHHFHFCGGMLRYDNGGALSGVIDT